MNSTSDRRGRRLPLFLAVLAGLGLFSGLRGYAYDATIVDYGSPAHSLYVYYDKNYANIGDTINVHIVESEGGSDIYEYLGEFGAGDFTLDPNGPWGYSVGGWTTIDRWITIVPNQGGEFDVGIMFSFFPSYEQIHAHITFTVPTPAAVITSATSVNRNQGDAPGYQITASNSPTSFGATSLPGGTSVNTSTGVISGRLNPSGTVSSTISASNAGGGQTVGLTWHITAAAITNTSSVSPAVIAPGQSVSITRSGTTNFAFGWTECVVWLPGGAADVQSNGGYGSNSYTPTAGNGTYTVQTRVADVYGNYTDKFVTFRVNSPPVVQSVSATNTAPGTPTQVTARATDVDGNLSQIHLYITGPGYSDTYVGSASVTNGSDCTLTTSWAPTGPGSFSVRIGATDTDSFYYGGAAVAASFTVAGPTTPASVGASTVGSSFVTLTWGASTVSGATITGYEVYRNGVKISGGSLVAGTSFTDSTVSPDTAYSYTVKAYDSNSNASATSAAFNTTSASSFEVFSPL